MDRASCEKKNSKTVIVVTDGDRKAVKAVERAAKKLGMYVVSRSAGTPTHVLVDEVEREIDDSEFQVVIVMADDGGKAGEGEGEKLVKALYERGLISAAVATASNTPGVRKVIVFESITDKGTRTKQAVNKRGRRQKSNALSGDTAEVLADLGIPVIGVGDPGKVRADRQGALAMEKALREAVNVAHSIDRGSRPCRISRQDTTQDSANE